MGTTFGYNAIMLSKLDVLCHSIHSEVYINIYIEQNVFENYYKLYEITIHIRLQGKITIMPKLINSRIKYIIL